MCTSILFTLRICVTSIIISHSHSYLLLAANMDDFKSIAKRFVPEKFVDQIANMAVAPGSKYRPEIRQIDSRSKSGHGKIKKRNENRQTYGQSEDFSKISFEQLVQMVKDRLQNDPGKENIVATEAPVSYEREVEPDVDQDQTFGPYHTFNQDEFYNPTEAPTTYKYVNNDYKDYPLTYDDETSTVHINWQDDEPQLDDPTDADQPFSKVEMIKGNDSYEDYVTPKREDNIFESPEVVEKAQTKREVHRTTKFIVQKGIPKTEALIKKLPKSLVNRSPSKHSSSVNERPNPSDIELQSFTQKHAHIGRPHSKSHKQPRNVNKPINTNAKHRFNVKDQKSIADKQQYGEMHNEYDKRQIKRIKKAEIHEEPPEKYHENQPNEDNPSPYDDNDYGKEYVEEKTEEPKAKTENLWYDDKLSNSTDNPEPEVQESVPKTSVTKRLKGTMIPKRDFYKMSSPNYFAKIPIVAEKYDFNEPIPERDREPEVLDNIDLGPAIINGKVRIDNKKPKE